MNTTFFQQLGDLIKGALTLNPAVFDGLGQYSQSSGVAIAIILLAGLSQSLGYAPQLLGFLVAFPCFGMPPRTLASECRKLSA
jgi:hypothetical protein